MIAFERQQVHVNREQWTQNPVNNNQWGKKASFHCSRADLSWMHNGAERDKNRTSHEGNVKGMELFSCCAEVEQPI